ncbi:MAG: hypothetical protein ACI9FR_001455 [Cryomorphaceae bacterium]|jgi:hypothetical protein
MRLTLSSIERFSHMTKLNKTLNSCAAVALAMFSHLSFAVNLNYDSLSSLEEPLAAHVADTTLVFSGLVDIPAFIDLQDDADTDTNLRSNFQITAETQLANSWTLGAGYFGSYDNDADDSFNDNAALFIGGAWGIVSIGNVTGLVREGTRRNRGAGNAALSYDDFLGRLYDDGVGYLGRFGPSRISANIDDNSNAEIGWMFQRPVGNKDYRFAVRLQSSEATFDNNTAVDSKGASGVAELTYGSSVFDIGIGHETLKSQNFELDRWFISSGVAYKIGRWTLSAQAHVGEIESQDERSYAIGMICDIARGLSLNLGVNSRESNIQHSGVTIRSDDSTEGVVSVRYSF